MILSSSSYSSKKAFLARRSVSDPDSLSSPSATNSLCLSASSSTTGRVRFKAKRAGAVITETMIPSQDFSLKCLSDGKRALRVILRCLWKLSELVLLFGSRRYSIRDVPFGVESDLDRFPALFDLDLVG